MPYKKITLETVIKSFEKYGLNFLKLDYKTINKKASKKYQGGTRYFTYLFVHPDGSESRLVLETDVQILPFCAKVPKTNNDDSKENMEDPTYIQVPFTIMEEDDIKGGDYVPKEAKEEHLQEAENKKMTEKIKLYSENSKKLKKVMDIIIQSVTNLTKELEENKNGDLSSKIIKTKEWIKSGEIPMNTFCQTEYRNEEGDYVKLDKSIYRHRLPIYNGEKCKGGQHGKLKKGDIGKRWENSGSITVDPIVMDRRKMTAKNGHKDVRASLKLNKVSTNLNYENVGKFINKKALVFGKIKFDTIVLSKAGFSIRSEINKLYVKSHKSTDNVDVQQDIINMCSDDEDEDDADDDDEAKEELDSDEDADSDEEAKSSESDDDPEEVDDDETPEK